MTFNEFPKIARLSRECVITEKIDGTNASVEIRSLAGHVSTAESRAALDRVVIAEHGDLVMLAGSRTRYIFPENDNYGFASWVKANAGALWALGEGQHFGEWWGRGIQRNYAQTGRTFSLFNVARWADDRDELKYPFARPACCDVVPTLYRGPLESHGVLRGVKDSLARLQTTGSVAAPGFMNPEGIVIYHLASGQLFKKTIEKDEAPKGRAA